MNQMFESKQSQLPLAEYLRPKTVSEIAGQKHILGEGKSLRVAIESGNLPSMILWGPPGVGKTTIARVIANSIDAEFISVSAVLSGVKDIREAIDKAQLNLQQYNKKTILFVDEVHRFNKSQQDAFLPHVESGLITFIGATTENPSFEVNSALLSRSQVYVLKMLDQEDLFLIYEKAKNYIAPDIEVDEEARQEIIGHINGDARRLLNFLELLFNTAKSLKIKKIDQDFLKKTITSKVRRFDKGGDQFYDQISAYWEVKKAGIESKIAKKLFDYGKKVSSKTYTQGLKSRYENAARNARSAERTFKNYFSQIDTDGKKSSEKTVKEEDIKTRELIDMRLSDFPDAIKKFPQSKIREILRDLKKERNETLLASDLERDEIYKKSQKISDNKKAKEFTEEEFRKITKKYRDKISDLRSKITIAQRYD